MTAAPAATGRALTDPAPERHWGVRIGEHVALVELRLQTELDDLVHAWQNVTPGPGVAYSANLPEQLRALMAHGGKRTRPVMTLLGWVAGDVHGASAGHEDMLRAACALELLHCFALVHDDVMDESATRRGRPTVHQRAAQKHTFHGGIGESRRFGDSIAMLVGDLAHSEADRLAASMPLPMRRVWQQMVVELIAGQTWDVVGSAAADRGLDFARSVARQKTGYYTVSRPLQLGAVAAGADDDALAALAEYGRHAGEAFALRDDVLGSFGDPAVTGKPAGDDIRSGKPTVLLALAAQALTGPAALALEHAGSVQMSEEQVQLVQQAMTEQGILAQVERMIDDRVADARAALRCERLSDDGVQGLTHMLTTLTHRGR